jgi:hypothetical protein
MVDSSCACCATDENILHLGDIGVNRSRSPISDEGEIACTSRRRTDWIPVSGRQPVAIDCTRPVKVHRTSRMTKDQGAREKGEGKKAWLGQSHVCFVPLYGDKGKSIFGMSPHTFGEMPRIWSRSRQKESNSPIRYMAQ